MNLIVDVIALVDVAVLVLVNVSRDRDRDRDRGRGRVRGRLLVREVAFWPFMLLAPRPSMVCAICQD